MTHFPFVQIMPMVWRILFWIEHVNKTKNLDLGLPEIASVYDLRNFGFFHIIFKIKPQEKPFSSKNILP